MLVIRIKIGQAQGREIKLKTGQVKQVAEQVGYIDVDDEVRKFRIPVDVANGQKPYEPGLYVLSASSFEVGQFRDLGINRYELRLMPLADAAQFLRSPKAA